MEANAKIGKKGSVSTSKVDAQRTAYLQSQQEVQSLKTRVSTLPFQLDVMRSKIEIAKASVEAKTRNLERTEVTLHHNAKISDVLIEENQFVGSGASLFKAETIDKVLIEKRFPIAHFQKLAKGFQLSQLQVSKLIDDANKESGDSSATQLKTEQADNIFKILI